MAESEDPGIPRGTAHLPQEHGESPAEDRVDIYGLVVEAVRHVQISHEQQVAELRGEVRRLQSLLHEGDFAGSACYPAAQAVPEVRLNVTEALLPHEKLARFLKEERTFSPAVSTQDRRERFLKGEHRFSRVTSPGAHGLLNEFGDFDRQRSAGRRSDASSDGPAGGEDRIAVFTGDTKPTRQPRAPESKRSREEEPRQGFGLPPPPHEGKIPASRDLPDVVVYDDAVEINVPRGPNNASRTLRAAFQAIGAANYWSQEAIGKPAQLKADAEAEPGRSKEPDDQRGGAEQHPEEDPEDHQIVKVKSVQILSPQASFDRYGSSGSVRPVETDKRMWLLHLVTGHLWEMMYALFVVWDFINISLEVELFLTGTSSSYGAYRMLAASSGKVAVTMESQQDFTLNDITAYPPSLEVYVSTMEHILTAVFLLDMVSRFFFFNWRQYIPTDPKRFSNLADVVLTVITNVLFVWILPLAGVRTLTKNPFLGLKCLRFVRLQRVVNTIMENRDLFKEMSLIIRGLSVSGRSFLSSILFITFVTYVFAVVGCVTLVPRIEYLYKAAEDDIAVAELYKLLHHLAHVDSFMFALAEFASKNPNILPPIMKYVRHSWILFYTYAAFLDLVLLNLIEAVAVENALANSEVEEHHKLLGQLNELFILMDENNDGTLSWQEFKSAFTNPQISQKWKLLDIDKSECKELFSLLDPGDGNIPMDDFFEGISRMKGQALSKDVFRMMKTLDDLVQAVSLMFMSGNTGPDMELPPEASVFKKPNVKDIRRAGSLLLAQPSRTISGSMHSILKTKSPAAESLPDAKLEEAIDLEKDLQDKKSDSL